MATSRTSRSTSSIPSSPGIANGFGKSGSSFTIKDEWYALKNMPDDLHVILVQVTEGMKGHMYERPNFPITWAQALRQGTRLLHLDGPPRGRLGEPEVPGPALRRPGLGNRTIDANYRAQ